MKLARPYTAWLALTLAALFPLSSPAQDENWAATINHLRDLYHQHKYEEALPLAVQAAKIAVDDPGPSNGHLAIAFNNLAQLESGLGHPEKAEPFFKRVVEIEEQSLGPDSPGTAAALNNYASFLDDQSRYAEAEPLYLRALRIDEKAFPPDDPQIAIDLNNLGQLYENQDRHADAEPLFLRALRINEKALGPDDPRFAISLGNLAIVYQNEHLYADAEPLFQRALAIREKTAGPDSAEVATPINNLAALYRVESRYPEAEQLFKRALAIDEKFLGPGDIGVAVDLNNLAETYEDQGRYAEAEPVFRRSLDIRNKALGPDDPQVAAALNNLGVLISKEGRLAETETLYQRALDIDAKAYGQNHSAVAADLDNIATLDFEEGKYTAAEQLYQRALGIDVKILGSDHPDVAAALNNLGQVEIFLGRDLDAEPIIKRAVEIDEKVFGPDHPSLAQDLNNLALLEHRLGRFSAAEPLYQRALAIDLKTLAPDHPEVSNTLTNLASLKYDEDDPAAAAPLFNRAFDSLYRIFQYNFAAMTEKERLQFLAAIGSRFPIYFSFVHRFHQQDPSLTGAMYNMLLWEKGFIAAGIANLRRQIEASGDPEALRLLATLADKRSQLAAVLNQQPTDRDAWRRQIDQLRGEADAIEKDLVNRSAAFAQQKKLDRATWQQVRDALKPGEAAIEFARFDFYYRKWTHSYHYAALVITHDTKDQPQYIFLGDDKQIEADAVSHFQHALETRGFLQQPEAAVPGPHAYQLIWKPLEPALAGVTRIYLAPDGVLNQVPLGIIPAPDGKLLMEKYDLRLVSSTRDLLAAPSPPATATALLVGDPVFDLTEEQQRAALAKLDFPSSTRPHAAPPPIVLASLQSRGNANGASLPRLPGTGQEVAAIAALMQKHAWKTAIFTGDQALKTVVEQASNPRVIHLATHGFFLPDRQIDTLPPGSFHTALQDAQSSPFNDPMLRSGLYFAAADRTLAGKPSPPDLDNGVLTALEAGNLNLRGTQLVVLSACDTGQGDVKNGEGVFGLRRALQEAGAQAVLMSLWSVPDQETQQLMQRFYAKWLSGIEVHQALKEAQLAMRAQVKAAHGGNDLPYYWGAFVLVGR